MRGKLSKAFMETNYYLLVQNPVSNITFNVLNLSQGVLAFASTWELLTNTGMFVHILERFYYFKEGAAFQATLIVLVAIEVLTIFLYLLLLLEKRLSHTSIKADITQQKKSFKCIGQLVTFLIVLNQTVMNLLTKSLSLRVLSSLVLEGATTTLLLIAVVALILNLGISVLFMTQLQTQYPLPQVPWALPNFRENLVNDIKVLLFALCLSIPTYATAFPWILGACCILTALMNLLTATYYKQMTSKVFALNQSTFVASELVMTLIFATNNANPLIRTITYIFLVALLVLLYWQTLDRLSNTLKAKHQLFKTVKGVQKWMWMVNNEFYFPKDIPIGKMRASMIKLQAVLKNHRRECFDSKCPCYKKKTKQFLDLREMPDEGLFFCKEGRLLIIEITMFTASNHFKKDGSYNSKVRCERLWNMFTYYQQDCHNNVLMCLFNLLKFHNCTNCSMSDCFQNYMLQQRIIDSTKTRQAAQSNIIQYEALISFETSLRSYVKLLEKTTSNVNDYWRLVSKGELDIIKAEVQGSKILDSYMEFKDFYAKLKSSCGEVIIVENMAMIFHRDVLKFEVESQQNWESLKTLMNQMRVMKSKSKIEPSFMTSTAQKTCLILVSCNPSDYMKIVVASKPFVKMVGFQDERLLNSKLHILLPNVVNEQHDSFVDEYLKSKRTKIDQAVTKRQWIRKADSSVKPVEISILPRVTLQDGIQLMAFVTEVPKIEIFDQQVDSALVFCFLADINDKLVHVSENCVNLLKISPAVADSDIVIHQLIVDLPDILEENQMFDSNLDLKPFYEGNQELRETWANMSDSKVKVCFKEKRFSSYLVLREYIFVVLKNSCPDQYFHAGDESNFTSIFTKINSYASNTVQENNQQEESEQSEQSELDGFQIRSQSTSSSSASTYGNKFAQVSDIKCPLQFEHLPVSLKWYRFKLIIGYLIILVAIVSLLGVNIKSKDQFFSYLSAVQIQKFIRNRYLTALLSLVTRFGISNISHGHDLTQIGVKVDNDNYSQFYRFNLHRSVDKLHQSVSTFSFYKNRWDEEFVETITEGQVEVTFISANGKIGVQELTFVNNMNQVIGRGDYISQLRREDMKVPWDIFKVTTIQQYADEIEKLSYNLNYMVSSFYTTLYNGSRNTLKQIFKIDERSTQSLLDQGDSVIDMLLGLTVGYALLVFLVTSCLIPYQFAVEQTQQKAVELANTTDSQHVQDILKNCNSFSQMLKKNQSLRDVKDSKTTQDEEAQQLKSFISERSNMNQFNVKTTSVNEYESKNNMLSTQMKVDSSFQAPAIVRGDEKEKPLKVQHNIAGKKNQQKDYQYAPQTTNNDQTPCKDDLIENDQEEQKDQPQQTNHENEESCQKGANDQLMLSSQSTKKKWITVLLLKGVAALIVALLFFVFALSRKVLNEFQLGILEYEVFYNKVSCISESMFFMQKTILFNESMVVGTENGDTFQKIFELCDENESSYREINQIINGMFQLILEKLRKLDSPQFCTYIGELEIRNEDCATDFNGIMGLGLQHFMTSLLAHLQQQRIRYNSLQESQRTTETLRDLFYNEKTWAFATLYFKYGVQIFLSIEDEAQESAQKQMENNFFQIILVLGIFIGVFAVLLLVCQARMVRKLQFKLVRSRMILKLIPSDMLVQIKERLGEINLKQL